MNKQPIIIQEFETKVALQKALKEYNVVSMFSVNQDSKTVKGKKLGYNTAILYMKPSLQLCPYSQKAGCLNACLYSAGRGRFNSVQQARKARSELYTKNPALFYSALVFNIRKLIKKYGDSLVIRLNGTSDIAHHLQPLIVDGKLYPNIMSVFPEVQFYDYTKVCSRVSHTLPSNYDLTLSYSEANAHYASSVIRSAIRSNTRVAVVFQGKLPESFAGLRVIDGDETDLRFLDENNVVGLKAKGEAKKDKTGFVIHTEEPKITKKRHNKPESFIGKYDSKEWMRIY